jgi:hypothetical protein
MYCQFRHFIANASQSVYFYICLKTVLNKWNINRKKNDCMRLKMNKFKRTPESLKPHATMYWPEELTKKESSTSIVPLLLKTQEKFISLLDVSDASPDAWKTTLNTSSELYPNLFLKHLMVLADFGAEPLKRIKPDLARMFPDGIMSYLWRGRVYDYKFKEITGKGQIDNKSLSLDGQSLFKRKELTGKIEDVAMILLHAAASIGPIPEPINDKCIIGTLIGNKKELDVFVKQRYIWVSKIISGASSNTMGQLAQTFVFDLLQEILPKWKFKRNGRIPGMSQNEGKTDMNFDIVAISPNKKHFGIEVAFQFTTNSVIERKAGQAKERQEQLHKSKHGIAYVIDGAGNFERESALRTICNYSDCTVALTRSEIELLSEYLLSYEKTSK